MKTQKVLNGRLCPEKKKEQNNNMETVSVVDDGGEIGRTEAGV